MSHGFSHVGVSTHDMGSTIHFYEKILGFRRIAEDHIRVIEGGSLRHVFFDVGEGECIAFLESNGVPGIPPDYDAGINRGLGVPHGMYHYAFKAASLDELETRRKELEEHGVGVSPIVDLGGGKSIYLRDPNGLQLEFHCQTRPFAAVGLHGEIECGEVEGSVAMLG